MIINNQISQTVRLYGLVEDHLRRAATTKQPMTLNELLAQGDIAQVALKGKESLKDCIKVLVRRGNVIVSRRDVRSLGRHGGPFENQHLWDLESPPFQVGVRKQKQAKVQPSEVQNVTPKVVSVLEKSAPGNVGMYELAASSKTAKEVELVLGGVSIIIGKNPDTGRLRIILEEA